MTATQVASEDFVLRDGNEGDIPFVVGSWLNAYVQRSRQTTGIAKPTVYAEHHKLIMAVIHDGAKCRMAVSREDPNLIFGWLALEGRTLHFIYVKKAFRRLGIARALMQGVEFDQFSHYTHDGDEVRKKFPDAKFNPYAIYGRCSKGCHT